MSKIVPIEKISEKIYLIGRARVMLDKDRSALYGVENRVLKQAVRRNIDRFPLDFMLELSTKGISAFKITGCDLKKRSTFKISSLYSQ
jgi:hypothetical protein